MYYILSKLFCEKKKLFGYSAMSVLLIPEAVQILVKNKFEITDEEVSLLHVECVLSRIALNDGMVQVRCALFPVKLRKRPLGLALHVSIFFLQLSHQSFSGLFVYLQHLEKVVRHASTLGDLFPKLIELIS